MNETGRRHGLALLAQAEVTVPYLSPAQLVPVWQRMRASPCFRRLDARQRAWFELVEATGRRDGPAMASGANAILAKGYAGKRADWRRFAVMAGMLGYIVSGKPGTSFAFWTRHGPDVLSVDEPDLDFRLLFTLTGQPRKAAEPTHSAAVDQPLLARPGD